MIVNVLNRPIFTCIISPIKNECKCIKQTNFYMHRKLNKNECKCIKQTNFYMHRKLNKNECKCIKQTNF